MQFISNSKKTGAFLPLAASNLKFVKKKKPSIDFELLDKLKNIQEKDVVSKFVSKKLIQEEVRDNTKCNQISGAFLPFAAENLVFVEKESIVLNVDSLEKLKKAPEVEPKEIQVFFNITRISEAKYLSKIVNSNVQDVEASEQKIFDLCFKLSEAAKIEEMQPDYSDTETFQFPVARIPRFDLVAALGWEEFTPDDKPPLDVANVCGFNSSWVYKCTPWRYYVICVDNITEGAWVPYPVMQRKLYEECEFITLSSGRQFSKDHSTDYK